MGYNKLTIFIKLLLEMKDFWLVRISFLFRFLKNIYGLKQFGQL